MAGLLAMDSDERDIFHYLQTWGANFVSAKEICRRAGSKKRYNEDNDWARGPLMRMAERGVVEGDSSGRFRVKPEPRKSGHERSVSPEMSKIVNESGAEIDGPQAEPVGDKPSASD